MPQFQPRIGLIIVFAIFWNLDSGAASFRISFRFDSLSSRFSRGPRILPPVPLVAGTLLGYHGPMMDPSVQDEDATEAGLTFDDQAPLFDQRAGVTKDAARSVGQAVHRLASLKKGDLLLEIGAGTGEIGEHLASSGVKYFGLDLSLLMLREFAKRVPAKRKSGAISLIQGDGDDIWPVEKGTIRAVFMSRAVHLLEGRHVLRETKRIARPDGAFLVLGRVRRPDECVRSDMRREMRRLLSAEGVEGRDSTKQIRKLCQDLIVRGGRFVCEENQVATWKVKETPLQSLNSWREKTGLAGKPVSAGVKQKVLTSLEAWAEEKYGSLEKETPSEDMYELTVIEFGAS